MAGVLKSSRAPTQTAFSFDDLDRQAQTILREAREQAREVLHAARQEAQRTAELLAEQARQRGYAEGREAGQREVLEEARQQLATRVNTQAAELIQTLSAAIARFESEKRFLLAAAETGLVRLALAIAQKICKALPARQPQVALENARTLLGMVQHQQDLALHLNPQDAEFVRSAIPALADALASAKHVRIVADETLARGGCVLRGEETEIDARLEQQLQMLADALLPGDDAAAGEEAP